MTESTKVGKFDVRLRDAKFASIVSFSSGAHGKSERGHYCFWTAVLKRPHQRKKVFGRSRITLPAGDRFDRMQAEMLTAKRDGTRQAYRRLWENVLGRGANIDYIRPSTSSEIARWIVSHKDDARHVIGSDYGR